MCLYTKYDSSMSHISGNNLYKRLLPRAFFNSKMTLISLGFWTPQIYILKYTIVKIRIIIILKCEIRLKYRFQCTCSKLFYYLREIYLYTLQFRFSNYTYKLLQDLRDDAFRRTFLQEENEKKIAVKIPFTVWTFVQLS